MHVVNFALNALYRSGEAIMLEGFMLLQCQKGMLPIPPDM